MAMTKVKNLQLWCKKMTEGYRDVNVVDMTKSWKDGLACCAIIHRFRPDLIDFDALSKENIFENNQLAFSVAESELGIPALLEAPDMVAMKVPDKLCVVTYVAQYYNYFHDKPQLGGPGVKKASGIKRHQDYEVSPGPEAKRLTPNHPRNTNKTPVKDRQVSMGDKCSICHEKVYLLERHVDNNRLYHRTCYRRSDLSPTSKIYDRPSGITPNRKTADDKILNNTEEGSSQPDFWSRRAEARKKENVDNKTDSHKSDVTGLKKDGKAFGLKDVNTSSNSQNSLIKEDKKDSSNSNISEWRKSRPADLKLSNVDEKNSAKNELGDYNKRNSSSVAKLKNFLKSDTDIKNGENDQKPNISNKNEESHPKAKPRNIVYNENKDRSSKTPDDRVKSKVLNKSEKMDTSETVLDPDKNKKSRPVPVPRSAQRKTEDMDIDHKSKHVRNDVKSTELGRKSPGFDLSPSSSSPPPLPSTAPPPVKLEIGSPGVSHQKGKTSFSPKESHISSDSSTASSKSTILQPSSPRHNKYSKDKLDKKSRDKLSLSSADKQSSNIDTVPVKPPRISGSNQGAQIAPTAMDVDEPSTAYLVNPKPDTQQDKMVLGGLLKSLANVRKSKSPEEPKSSHEFQKPMDTSKPGEVSKSNKISGAIIADKSDTGKISKSKVISKSAVDTESDSKNVKNKQNFTKTNHDRTTNKSNDKSDSTAHLRKEKSELGFVTNKLSIFVEENGATSNRKLESHVKQSSGNNKYSSTDSDIPSWKRKVEQNRPKSTDFLSVQKSDQSNKTEWQIEAEKRKSALEEKLKPRPKSVETILDNKHEGVLKPPKPESAEKRVSNDKRIPPRPKSADLLSRNVDVDSQKPDWQLEAEKRIVARQGGYVDPEKPKPERSNVQLQSQETKLDHVKISPTIPKRPDFISGHKSAVISDSKVKHADNKHLSDIIGRKDTNVTDNIKINNKVPENDPLQAKRRVLPTPPKEDTQPKFEKKKISVGINFDFNSSLDFDEDKTKKPSKPPRSPLRSPVSPISPVEKHIGPLRPPPPRKEADKKRLSPLEIQSQLVNIDDKLTKLEVRGRQLEDSIRKDDSDFDSTIELDDLAQEDSEDETQMIEWFKLVNEKNELIRKEADLIYASRQQELEDEQHELDIKLRNLMMKPDSEKTEEEKQEEEYLLQKLLDTVNQRSLIVDSQDEDRIRYEQEDRDIAEVLALKGFMKDNSTGDVKKQKKKKGKK